MLRYACTISDLSWERVHLTLIATLTPEAADETDPDNASFPDWLPSESAREERDLFQDEPEAVESLEDVIQIDDDIRRLDRGGDLVTDPLSDQPAHDSAETAAFAAGQALSHGPEGVTFTLRDGKRTHPVPSEPLGGGRYRLQINITNFDGRRQVPDGTWRFQPLIDGTPCPAARFDVTTLDQLEDASRVFLYDGNRTAMTVSFGITESEIRPEFLMRTYQLFRKKKTPKKKPPVSTRLRRRVINRKQKVKWANKFYTFTRSHARNTDRRILFASAQRTHIEGNLARVRDRMVERGLDQHFDFKYSFSLPQSTTKLATLKTIYRLAISDTVLIDDYFGMLESLKLDRTTKLVQLWHAGSGFKSIGYSRFGKYGSPRLQNAHRKYTYAITGSKHLVPVYAEAFGIENEAVVATGLPRIDWFLDPERTAATVERFYADYPELRGKRLVLFAPTFRGRGIKDAYYEYSRIDFDALYEMCGDDTRVLFRMHHFIKTPAPIPDEYKDRLLDFSDFPQTNDLLQVTDVLITDYSSIIYEFSLLNRPILFYAYDKDNYSATRGFHRDYDETAPGRVCATFDDVVDALRHERYDLGKLQQFRDENFDYVDTGSADRVIDRLILSSPQKTSGPPVAASLGSAQPSLENERESFTLTSQ